MSAVTIKDLKGDMCKWPIGDPQEKDFHFCGRRRDTSCSYCDEHAGQAYRKDSSRRFKEN